MIAMSMAAKRWFDFIRPDVGEDGEVMRLDAVRQDESPGSKLVVYVGEPEGGDQPIEHEGEALLYVSRGVWAAYDGCVVDLEETPEGALFVIGPPYSGGGARA